MVFCWRDSAGAAHVVWRWCENCRKPKKVFLPSVVFMAMQMWGEQSYFFILFLCFYLCRTLETEELRKQYISPPVAAEGFPLVYPESGEPWIGRRLDYILYRESSVSKLCRTVCLTLFFKSFSLDLSWKLMNEKMLDICKISKTRLELLTDFLPSLFPFRELKLWPT